MSSSQPHILKNLTRKTFADLISVEQLPFPSATESYSDPNDTFFFRSLVIPYRPFISRGVFGKKKKTQKNKTFC